MKPELWPLSLVVQGFTGRDTVGKFSEKGSRYLIVKKSSQNGILGKVASNSRRWVPRFYFIGYTLGKYLMQSTCGASKLIIHICKNLTKISAYSQNGVGGDCARRVWIIPIPHLDRSLP